MAWLSASAVPLVFVFSIHAQVMTAHTAFHELSGVPIVQVSVNGTGPYSFVLDTGANVTVMTRQLFRDLHMPMSGSVRVSAALGETDQERAWATTLDLAGLRVEHVEVNTLEDSQLGTLRPDVQGILGENFLKHFDILIDNDHHQVALDRTTHLSQSVTGEHVLFARAGMDNSLPTRDRIVVPLRLSLLTRTLLFVLDSGTNTLMLFPMEQEAASLVWGSGYTDIESLSRTQTCHIKRTTVAIASQRFPEVRLAACESRTRDKTDSDGLLPTRIFHRLFISYQQGFLIANPRGARRSDGS